MRGVGTNLSGSVERAEPVPIEQIEVDDRPRLTLVIREGDPSAAVAFVARHTQGSIASAGLLGLVQARLEAAGLRGTETRAHALGFEVSRLVASEAELSRFFVAIERALRAPVREGDPALPAARKAVQSLGTLRFAGPGESAVAACSGELGIDADARLELPVERLEAVRKATYRVDAAAFSVVGNEKLLEEAEDALKESDRWPSRSADADTWPSSDLVAVDQQPSGRMLSVALWVHDVGAAVAAGDRLGAPDSELIARLRTLSPAWQLRRASAVARPKGACLRLDISPPEGGWGPGPTEIGRVAAIAERVAQNALVQAEPGVLEETVLRPADPRRAATLGAWRALPNDDEPSELRRTVAYVSRSDDGVTKAELEKALGEARARLNTSSIELTERVESGQGEVWMLLASPCGTLSESVANAGAFALLLNALAQQIGTGGVRFEPWVTPDGVGLLAHGARARVTEGALTQAARIARALGQALTTPLSGVELSAARGQLLNDLGGRAFSGYAVALEGLSPDHPSWLEPRGLWQSVSELPIETLDRARRLLLSSPLRLSVLSTLSGEGAVAQAELESWLLPFRSELKDCPSTRGAAAPRHGQTQVEVRSEPSLEGAYVGVVLGANGASSARIAELAALLLNRPGGPLERALAGSGPGATARAHALGGMRRPVVLVDIRALSERLPGGVDRVRGALDQLARGAMTKDDYQAAVRELVQRDQAARFDPRRRIVDLFRGEPPAEPDFAAVRAALSAFGSSAHWVVTVVPR